MSDSPYRDALQPPVRYLTWSVLRRIRRIVLVVVFSVIHAGALWCVFAASTRIPVQILAICVMFANAVVFRIATGTRSRGKPT